MKLYIRKASGTKELFDVEKFRRSLEKAGADKSVIGQLIFEIQQLPKLRTTKEIYGYALNRLQKEQPSVAARYNIKRALFDLGPAGFSFEQFVAEIFRAQGFTVITDQVEQGFCVEHELDIIMSRNATTAMVECKFHNTPKFKTDIKVALYCKARFDDIKRAWDTAPDGKKQFHESWLVTNTRFTSEAIRYAYCVSIELLGWSYPTHQSLPMLIDRYGLYPVTALPYLSGVQKRLFIREGFVLCRDAQQYAYVMKNAGLTTSEIERIITDTYELCATRNHKR
jgi:hypothetical protein